MACVSLQNLLEAGLNESALFLSRETPCTTRVVASHYKHNYRASIRDALPKIHTIGDFIDLLPDLCGPEWTFRGGIPYTWSFVKGWKTRTDASLCVDGNMSRQPVDMRVFAAVYSSWRWAGVGEKCPAYPLIDPSSPMAVKLDEFMGGRTFDLKECAAILKRWGTTISLVCMRNQRT